MPGRKSAKAATQRVPLRHHPGNNFGSVWGRVYSAEGFNPTPAKLTTPPGKCHSDHADQGRNRLILREFLRNQRKSAYSAIALLVGVAVICLSGCTTLKHSEPRQQAVERRKTEPVASAEAPRVQYPYSCLHRTESLHPFLPSAGRGALTTWSANITQILVRTPSSGKPKKTCWSMCPTGNTTASTGHAPAMW